LAAEYDILYKKSNTKNKMSNPDEDIIIDEVSLKELKLLDRIRQTHANNSFRLENICREKKILDTTNLTSLSNV
jgi:hypothetical protein